MSVDAFTYPVWYLQTHGNILPACMYHFIQVSCSLSDFVNLQASNKNCKEIGGGGHTSLDFNVREQQPCSLGQFCFQYKSTFHEDNQQYSFFEASGLSFFSLQMKSYVHTCTWSWNVLTLLASKSHMWLLVASGLEGEVGYWGGVVVVNKLHKFSLLFDS